MPAHRYSRDVAQRPLGLLPLLVGLLAPPAMAADADIRLAYDIEDPESPLPPTREDGTEGAQVDPASTRGGSIGKCIPWT